MLIQNLRRVRERTEVVDDNEAHAIAKQVIERGIACTEAPSFRDPRGEWDPGFAELHAAVACGDREAVKQIVGWCLLYCTQVKKVTPEGLVASVDAVHQVLAERDEREERFAILKSPWAKNVIKKTKKKIDVAQISPEKPGPLYFHRVFEDVITCLQIYDNDISITAVVWENVPIEIYEDAFKSPKDFVIAQRKRGDICTVISVASEGAWKPDYLQIVVPLQALPPGSEAGEVFQRIIQSCIRVAKFKQANCTEEIRRGVIFGCQLGQGTQLDRTSLEFLKSSTHFQASLGRALMMKPSRQDSSAVVGLFMPISPVWPS